MVRGLTGRVLAATSCRYTLTPDEDFIIDTHPEHPQIVIASACSGHGFKFGIEIGRILAALALGEEPGGDLTRFRLDRPFADGRVAQRERLTTPRHTSTFFSPCRSGPASRGMEPRRSRRAVGGSWMAGSRPDGFLDPDRETTSARHWYESRSGLSHLQRRA